MIVELTDAEIAEIDYQADYQHNRVWDAIRESFLKLDDADDEYAVYEGDDNEIAEEVMDAFWEAQETDQSRGRTSRLPSGAARAGRDVEPDAVYPTRDDLGRGGMGTRLSMLGQRIVNHMDYGLAYGFNDDDWQMNPGPIENGHN